MRQNSARSTVTLMTHLSLCLGIGDIHAETVAEKVSIKASTEPSLDGVVKKRVESSDLEGNVRWDSMARGQVDLKWESLPPGSTADAHHSQPSKRQLSTKRLWPLPTTISVMWWPWNKAKMKVDKQRQRTEAGWWQSSFADSKGVRKVVVGKTGWRKKVRQLILSNLRFYTYVSWLKKWSEALCKTCLADLEKTDRH